MSFSVQIFFKNMIQKQYPNILPSGKTRTYSTCPSLLDKQNPESSLNKSSFKGFFNMCMIFGFLFIFTTPILNKIENGYFLEPSLYTRFMNEYFLCMLVWPLFFFWSFTSFFIQKLILKGISPVAALILQHSTQAGLFLFSTVIILVKDWCSTHAAFVIMLTCVHFMKMHSYTTVNRDLREQYQEAKKFQRESRSNYPQNINVKDFVLFMWTPWIVYDNYPRRETMSISYIMKKSITCLACILAAYIVHTEYIIPYIQMGSEISFLELYLREMLPGTFFILILFFATFENITNIFAEITKLDHRQFYEDWWNSTTYEEFNRKWNKPVHVFLYRHVYLELIIRYKVSKIVSQMVTFLFSAFLHEFLLAIIFRIIRPIFLVIILIQIPLIYLTKSMRGKKSGSYFFWHGILSGPAFIIVCYLRVNDEVTDLFTRV